MTAHSESYTQPQQCSFVAGWFTSWSTLQREDFVQALAQKLQPRLYVNGLIGGLERLGRPPSIFQCQVKLFQEWSDSWTGEQREQLRQRLVAADPAFGTLLDAALGDADGRESCADSGMSDGTAPDVDADADLQHVEDASIDSQSSELTPTEI